MVEKEIAVICEMEFLLLMIAMLTSMVMLVFMALTVGIGFCVNMWMTVMAISMTVVSFGGLLYASVSYRTRRSFSF